MPNLVERYLRPAALSLIIVVVVELVLVAYSYGSLTERVWGVEQRLDTIQHAIESVEARKLCECKWHLVPGDDNADR